jgi:molybdate transport system ATP-binding protein
VLSVAISKKLREFPLDVAFAVTEGEALVLIGPTGCGKTMTLRSIAGLERPDSGSITCDGAPLFDSAQRVNVPPEKRHIGFVFQSYALFPHLTAVENVAYGPISRGVGRARSLEVARDALAQVGLSEFGAQRPLHLSGGQQQRVALARALAGEARVLLMDEPVAALDAQTRRDVRGELRGVIERIGVATVIVTHDHIDALTLGDRLCVMRQGQIIQQGTRTELLTRPQDEFVADFLGLNLFRGTATIAADDTVEVQVNGAVLCATEKVSGDVFLTCHPSDITLTLDAPEGSALNVIRGEVSGIVHLGGTARITVAGALPLVAEISERSLTALDLKVGDQVCASFKASAARCYR